MAKDLSKLPKWAQNRITLLERNVEHLKAKLNAGPEDSDTIADPYGSAPRPLGKGTTVHFVVPKDQLGIQGSGNYYSVRLNKDGVLEVGSGMSELDIHPRSSNGFDVDLVAPSHRRLAEARKWAAIPLGRDG